MNRRRALRLGLGVAAGSIVAAAQKGPVRAMPPESKCPIRLGKVCWVGPGGSIDDEVRAVREAGLSACQIGMDGLSVAHARPLRAALDRYGVEGTAISEHNPGPRIFDFYQGPATIGIIPRATRAARIRALQTAADVAHAAAIPAIHTHCGFIPEDPNEPLYAEAVDAVREVAMYCRSLGVSLLCETGQETPITMVRLIEDVGLDNVFVNLDVANLILYGKGNPVDAMDVLGERVRGIHAKDGRFPKSTRTLGQQVPVGEGCVDFPRLLERLRFVRYEGTMLLELESGSEEERRRDLMAARDVLATLLARTYFAEGSPDFGASDCSPARAR